MVRDAGGFDAEIVPLGGVRRDERPRLGLTEETKDERDLGQTRLAIETMRALTPVLSAVVPGELIRDFEQSVANMQLAYAKAKSEEAGAEG